MDPEPLKGVQGELKVQKIIQMMKITKKSDPLFKPLKKLKNALDTIGYKQISLMPTKTVIIFHFGLGNQLDLQFIRKANVPKQITQSNPIIPGKSFCFLKFTNHEQASKYLENNFKKIIADIPAYFNQTDHQNLRRVLISLFTKDKQINNFEEILELEETPERYAEGSIPGLLVMENFISKEEEMELLSAIDSQKWSKLNNRRVQHYGYQFKYGRNQIDKDQSYESPMPEFITNLLNKLKKLDFGHSFDQMTINDYFSGDGIPPHFDTHSPFEEKFVAISLLSGIAMDWRKFDGVERSVYLPPRSLIIFSGQSRYAWTHGISCRKFDKINGQLRHRSRRISITLRKIKYDKCSCPYYFFCDSQGYDQSTMKKNNPLLQKYIAQNINKLKLETKSASEIYQKYVYDAYQGFGLDFHNKAIEGVEKLIGDCFKSHILGSNYIQILDVGCGNGEYKAVMQKMYSENKYHYIGTQICDKMKPFEDKVLMDGLNLAFKEGSFEIVLCIAVLHHMSNEQQRVKMLKQLRKAVSENGAIIISVFGHRQKQNIYKDQDILLQYCVPYSKRIEPSEKSQARVEKKGYVYERYYHLFKKQELKYLCQVAGLQIKLMEEDKENIILLVTKLNK